MSEAEGMCSIPGRLVCAPKGNKFVATLEFTEAGETEDLEIGSLNLGIAIENEEIRKEFNELMRKVIIHIVTHNDPESKVVFSK